MSLTDLIQLLAEYSLLSASLVVHFVEGTSFADRDASGSGSTGNNELRPMARTKRVRMHYTPYQLGILENQFKWNQYASYSERGILAKQLQLSEKQVKVWFQNRRSKDRQRKKMEGAAADEQKLLPDGGPGGSPIGESSCTKERAVSSDGGIGEGTQCGWERQCGLETLTVPVAVELIIVRTKVDRNLELYQFFCFFRAGSSAIRSTDFT